MFPSPVRPRATLRFVYTWCPIEYPDPRRYQIMVPSLPTFTTKVEADGYVRGEFAFVQSGLLSEAYPSGGITIPLILRYGIDKASIRRGVRGGMDASSGRKRREPFRESGMLAYRHRYFRT